MQVKGLPFNRYSWLTTHNAFARLGEKSSTGAVILSPTNQQDSITSQLNVILLPPSPLVSRKHWNACTAERTRHILYVEVQKRLYMCLCCLMENYEDSNAISSMSFLLLNARFGLVVWQFGLAESHWMWQILVYKTCVTFTWLKN